MPYVHEKAEILVKIGTEEGVTAIPSPSPLTRLNYYDGKFLRAADLKLEQEHLRRLNALSNQAGGPGVVHGFDCVLAGGDLIEIGPGLAIDPAGRVLVLPQEKSLALGDLIEASRRRELRTVARKRAIRGDLFHDCDPRAAEEPAEGLDGAVLYVITIGHAEAYCGEEDVYGKLCEQACVTSTDRPYILEGVVVRAIPLQLSPLVRSGAFPLSRLHLRSRVASAYFEDERLRIGSLISGEGLKSEAWCLGALPLGGTDVPIAVVARAGTSTVFLDAWTVRRERMDAPPRQYWAWRMAMRPWSVFLAQVLQFQCQLRDVFDGRPDQGGDVDPCKDEKGLLHEAARTLGEMMQYYGKVSAGFAKGELAAKAVSHLDLEGLRQRLLRAGQAVYQGADRILLRRGIVELPSAGYLPVLPSSTLTVNQQVRRLMGPGVDLRFCVVRPDYVPHALEEAQHMERISLLQGLDNPQDKPEVDILVPEGIILNRDVQAEGLWFRVTEAGLDGSRFGFVSKLHRKEENHPIEEEITVDEEAETEPAIRGIAHAERLPSGGGAFYFVGTTPGFGQPEEESPNSGIEVRLERQAITWMALRFEADPFASDQGASVPVSLRIVRSLTSGEKTIAVEMQASGAFQIDFVKHQEGAVQLAGRLSGFIFLQRDSATTSTKGELGLTVSYKEALGKHAVSVAVNELPGSRILVGWGGAPLTVSVILDREKEDLIAKLEEDAEVKEANDADHVLALKALKALGTALQDSRFAEDAKRLLFPPPKLAAEELEVRAVHDWVLFHRRRTRTCAAEAVKAEPARKYEVLHLQGNEDVLQAVWKALRAGEVLPRFRLQRVTAVDFAGGSSVLVSDAADVLDAWKAVGPGGSVRFAGIATQGAAVADGEALAEARLSRLANVLETPLAPGAALEILPKVPAALAAPGTDGVIVLLTMEEAQTTCVTVYRAGSHEVLKQLGDQAQVAGGLFQELVDTQTTLIGQVEFTAGTPDIAQENDIGTKWQNESSIPPEALLVVGFPGTPQDNLKLYGKQADVLFQKLGGQTLQSQQRVVAAETLPGTCPALVFFVTD